MVKYFVWAVFVLLFATSNVYAAPDVIYTVCITSRVLGPEVDYSPSHISTEPLAYSTNNECEGEYNAQFLEGTIVNFRSIEDTVDIYPTYDLDYTDYCTYNWDVHSPSQEYMSYDEILRITIVENTHIELNIRCPALRELTIQTYINNTLQYNSTSTTYHEFDSQAEITTEVTGEFINQNCNLHWYWYVAEYDDQWHEANSNEPTIFTRMNYDKTFEANWLCTERPTITPTPVNIIVPTATPVPPKKYWIPAVNG